MSALRAAMEAAHRKRKANEKAERAKLRATKAGKITEKAHMTKVQYEKAHASAVRARALQQKKREDWDDVKEGMENKIVDLELFILNLSDTVQLTTSARVKFIEEKAARDAIMDRDERKEWDNIKTRMEARIESLEQDIKALGRALQEPESPRKRRRVSK